MKMHTTFSEITPSQLRFSTHDSLGEMSRAGYPAAGTQVSVSKQVTRVQPDFINRMAQPMHAPWPDSVPPAIDEWLRRNGLNHYGDAPDTIYLGGNPLFYPRNGGPMSRLDYILRRHPGLTRLLPGGCLGPKDPFPVSPSPLPPMLPQPMPVPRYPGLPNLRGLYDTVRQLMEMRDRLINFGTPPTRPMRMPVPIPPPLLKPLSEMQPVQPGAKGLYGS